MGDGAVMAFDLFHWGVVVVHIIQEYHAIMSTDSADCIVRRISHYLNGFTLAMVVLLDEVKTWVFEGREFTVDKANSNMLHLLQLRV